MQNSQLKTTCGMRVGNGCWRPCSWLLKTLTPPLYSTLKCKPSVLSKSLSEYGVPFFFFFFFNFSSILSLWCLCSFTAAQVCMCDCKTERRTQEKNSALKVNREREGKDRHLCSACLTACVGPAGKHRLPVIPVKEAARKIWI